MQSFPSWPFSYKTKSNLEAKVISLIDGPCAGTYMVKRAPMFLRAVINLKQEKDVLDQVADYPHEDEVVHVYKLESGAGQVHLHMSPRSKSGWYALGNYRYLPDVQGEQLRDNTAWQAWASYENTKLDGTGKYQKEELSK